jgi:hypothetical protein
LNSSSTATTTLTLPTGLSGTYYVVACANAFAPFAETNKANNCSPTAAITIAAADVSESGVTVSGTLASGGTIQVTDTVTDSVAAAPSSVTYFFLTTSATAQTGTTLGNRHVASLPSGTSSTATTTMTLPTGLSGTYYVVACANAFAPFPETNTANNCWPSAAIVMH